MMSLASRHAPPVSGAAHNVLPAVASNAITGAAPALTSATQAAPNQVGATGRGGSSALMSLFNSGLSVPRHVLVQARGALDNLQVSIHLNFTGTIGQGTFGQIERATLTIYPDPSSDQNTLNAQKSGGQSPLQVAVKRVLQDPRYKNRELSIMQRLNNHQNVVKFYYYYYSTSSSNNRSHRSSSGRGGSTAPGVDIFLHLVLECFPESLCDLIYRYQQKSLKVPTHMIKVFTYQMLKALAYLHSHQICHRDIKSSNLLVDESTLVLKVCDFGSAKEMVPGTANVSYISSRYYRAPELLFGAQIYTCAIDTWSGGCVLAEMLRQQCLFVGADSVDQLVKIIRVLGTPSTEDISSMNPTYNSYNFPDVQSCPVRLFFPQYTNPDLLALMSKMLVYNPTLRISPLAALSEPCFQELRDMGPKGILPGYIMMPPGLLDPNPDLSNIPSHVAQSETGTATGQPSNNHPHHTDTRLWNASSNKKTGDIGGVAEKKNMNSRQAPREIAGDWHKKGRPLGSQGSGAVGGPISSNPSLAVTQANADSTAAAASKIGYSNSSHGTSKAIASSKRTGSDSSGHLKRSSGDADAAATPSDYVGPISNGGGDESRPPAGANQSLKGAYASDLKVKQGAPEADLLNELSS
ncbi:hypothetical protein P879_05509 [Paragonimus westermani]|uniref:Protein kinase domain-containing protein n=1 Tax=Paragonimus westermani TaxID=34504 RepID=A0A8T0DDG3_9TREM|nr:hypothetical protein P879_05509 [Paragonimus westermani]